MLEHFFLEKHNIPSCTGARPLDAPAGRPRWAASLRLGRCRRRDAQQQQAGRLRWSMWRGSLAAIRGAHDSDVGGGTAPTGAAAAWHEVEEGD
jgi:hypothetical protein